MQFSNIYLKMREEKISLGWKGGVVDGRECGNSTKEVELMVVNPGSRSGQPQN
jgi:hypothetical protein